MERIINFVTNMTLTSVLIGAAAGLVVYWLIQKLRYRKPPGPFALPLIGNYKLFSDKVLHKTCMKMAEKYGPIMKIQLGPLDVVILNNIESVTEALIQRGSDFADRRMTAAFSEISEGGKDIVFAPYNATWKLHRKIVSKALREYLKGDMLQTALQTSVTKVSKLFTEQTEPFDPAEYMDFTVFNVLSHLCYKEEHSFDDPEFKRMMQLSNDLLHLLSGGLLEDIFPYLKDIFPSKKYQKLTSMLDEAYAIMNKKLKHHRETFDPDNIRDFVDSLLLARQEAEQEDDAELLNKLTETHIRQTLSNIFFAGIDTSRFTLTWAILYVAAYPDIQAKCQKEIDSVVENGRQVVLSDKRRLPFTDACLMEIMRMGMAVPFGVPHAARCDSKIGGYDIPKGTIALVNHYALHMDPRHWENPTKFDPNRYLDESGNMKQKPDSWLPFSAGRRVCLGESIAKPELFTIFASVLHQFKISLPEGVVPKFESIGGILNPVPIPYKIIVNQRR